MTETNSGLKDYSQNQELIITWDEFHQQTRNALSKICKEMEIKGIIAVARGGVYPAGIFAQDLDIRNIDIICSTSYENKKQLQVPKLTKCPEGDGEGYIIIDDIVDTGKTIREIKKRMPKAHYVAVYAKQEGIDLVDSYSVAVDQNVWVTFPWDL
ncbi:MAG: xanthine phosphoribosyltransferase [Alphaproteobacteria bacterium]|nr:xanthine phosphoribosyltransferase [Alphaproteobacteria bacterium]